MDMANLALARTLSQSRPVHLVTHRADETLSKMNNVTIQNVWRPLNANLLGDFTLRRAGRKQAAKIAGEGGRVLVNGGNCRWHDINWLHYVHAAYIPNASDGMLRRAKRAFTRSRWLRDERAIVSALRVVICNSDLTARHAVELLGTPERAIRVVYYGIDAERFRRTTVEQKQQARRELGWDDRPWAVFMGAMGDARKGFDTLYNAWRSRVALQEWDANLAVVGSGASLSAWQERAKLDGLEHRIVFMGFRSDVPRILSACDLMVHPARYEAYGLGVQEAIATGLPVLVSANAGVAERYPTDLSELLITNPNDAGELADRLKHWRRNLGTWSSRVAALTAKIRSRSWDDMAKQILDAAEQ